MRHIKTEGIVLKRKNIGEADRILTVFTRHLGKIQVKAKGVRKISSKRASHIEPLNSTIMTIYKGQGMPVLLEVQAQEQFGQVKTDLQKLGLAYHLCELVDGLCPENQENQQVFELLLETFSKLGTDCKSIPLIHGFEVELLTLLGYWSEGSIDLTGSKASYYIESILERKLKTRQILPRLFAQLRS